MTQELQVDLVFNVQEELNNSGYFNGDISFTNNSEYFQGWTIEFDATFEIDNIWNGEIVSHIGNHYVIKDVSSNDNVYPGETTTFGFTAHVDNSTITEPVNYIFNQQPLNTSLKEIDEQNFLASISNNLIGEIGTITNLNHLNRTIEFQNQYVNPVVFALPVSNNGGDPAIARITDIQDDQFSVYIQEAEYKDGYHTNEAFSYMVVEAGTWELDDGTIVQVGTVDTNNTTASGWETVNFSTDFSNTPAVLSQVQTDNDDTFVRTRQRQTNNNSFQLALEEEEKLRQSGHGTESVGWLAIETGEGTWNGMKYQAGTTGEQVTSQWHELDFDNFSKTPNLLAGLGSYEGGDSAGLRYTNLDSDGVQIRVEEDTSLDTEINHKSEVVNFLALEGAGNLTGISYENNSDDNNEDDDTFSRSLVSRPNYNKSEGFFTLDGKLYDANGSEFIPRGINNLHVWYDDNNNNNVNQAYDALDNIASFGFNSVRIVWEVDFLGRPTNDGMLEQIIQRTIDLNMVPMVEIHDFTGSSDTQALLDEGVKWWTDRAALWEKYEKYLIIDVANEFGNYAMANKGDRRVFANVYKEAITRMRNAGIDNTLVVEPFQWGKDYTLIRDYGQEIYNHDPQKNVMFSPHIYCGQGESSATMRDMFDSLTGKELPFMIGEFSDKTYNGAPGGNCDIKEQTILSEAQEHGIGHYVWAWYNGSFSMADNWEASSRGELTSWGEELIFNNPNGISATSEIATIFDVTSN